MRRRAAGWRLSTLSGERWCAAAVGGKGGRGEGRRGGKHGEQSEGCDAEWGAG